MKKTIYIFIFIFMFNMNIYANEISLNKCIDGDTAKFNIDNRVETIRFLAIDTPEKDEQYGKEASEHTCEKLKLAKEIEVELDSNSNKYDKYNRLLAWLWVDKELLQNDIIKEGYGKVAYLYGEYKYTNILKKSEIEAKINKKGLWKDNNSNQDLVVLIIIFTLTVLGLVFKRYNKYFKRIIKSIKKEVF